MRYQVQDQFQIMYEAGDKLEEAFIMGNRLIKFLSEVLPTHEHYYVDSKHRPDIGKLRIQTQNNLLQVRKQMEDIALAFDKEIYKIEMEKQGLEFDLSPGRIVRGRRTRRKKIVKFAVEDDEHHDCEYRFTQQKQQAQSSFEEQDTINQPFQSSPPKSLQKKYQESDDESSFQVSTFSDSKFDLSLWEERDPGMEVVNMSFSSGENSIGTDDQSSLEESAFQVEDGISSLSSANHHFEGKLDGNHSKLKSPSKHNIEVDLFNPADEDGWESVKDTPDLSFDWPELEGLEIQKSFMKNDVPSQENIEVNRNDHSNLVARNERSKDNDDDDDDDNTDIDDDISQHTADFEGINDSLDTLLEENVSFVEKIALENINSGINELRDINDEDSDAADSWEQNDTTGIPFLDNKEDDHCHMNLSLDNEMTIATCDTTNSSGAVDDIAPKLVHSSSIHDEHLVALQQEFMSSFDLDDDDDEKEHYEKDCHQSKDDELKITKIEYVEELTTCDSCGADKTVVTSATAETEAMTADDDSERSNSSDCDFENDNAIIGISRRDDYCPSFDSPQRQDESGLSRRLDNVEDRIEDLQVVKQEYRGRTLLQRTNEDVSIDNLTKENDPVVLSDMKKHVDNEVEMKYPIQMPRIDVRVKSEVKVEEMNMSKHQKSNTQPKPEPCTATGTCRLKNIRQTQAWRRRYR